MHILKNTDPHKVCWFKCETKSYPALSMSFYQNLCPRAPFSIWTPVIARDEGYMKRVWKKQNFENSTWKNTCFMSATNVAGWHKSFGWNGGFQQIETTKYEYSWPLSLCLWNLWRIQCSHVIWNSYFVHVHLSILWTGWLSKLPCQVPWSAKPRCWSPNSTFTCHSFPLTPTPLK